MSDLKFPILNLATGSVAALGTFSDTLTHVPGDIIETVVKAPENWDDMEKALIAMGVSILSQFVLTVTPKLFKSILNLFKKSKNERITKKSSTENTINSSN